MRTERHIEISVVAPCYNEEKNILPFLNRLDAIMLETGFSYEVIIVDDGSTDHSQEVLWQNVEEFPLEVISLARNFGQQAALLAGIHNAKGRAIVTIDLDLQQPPELIPQLIALWRQGAMIVHAIPTYHRSATWHKKLTSKLYYRVLKVLGSDVVYKANDFRIFDRKVGNIVKELPEKNLYLRGLFSWMGFKQDTLEYLHRPRIKGDTKYSYLKMFNLALRGLASQSITPLRIGLFIGVLSIGLALALIAWALVVHFLFKQTVAGWTSLVIVLLFFSSINFLLLGIIGEYVGQLFIEVKGRPQYLLGDAPLMKDGQSIKEVNTLQNYSDAKPVAHYPIEKA